MLRKTYNYLTKYFLSLQIIAIARTTKFRMEKKRLKIAETYIKLTLEFNEGRNRELETILRKSVTQICYAKHRRIPIQRNTDF